MKMIVFIGLAFSVLQTIGLLHSQTVAKVVWESPTTVDRTLLVNNQTSSSGKSAEDPIFPNEIPLGLGWRMSEVETPNVGRTVYLRLMSMDDLKSPERHPTQFFIRMSQEKIEMFITTGKVISDLRQTFVTLIMDGKPEFERWNVSQDKTSLFYNGDAFQMIQRLETCHLPVLAIYTPDSNLPIDKMFYFDGIKAAMNEALQLLKSGASKP